MPAALPLFRLPTEPCPENRRILLNPSRLLLHIAVGLLVPDMMLAAIVAIHGQHLSGDIA